MVTFLFEQFKVHMKYRRPIQQNPATQNKSQLDKFTVNIGNADSS